MSKRAPRIAILMAMLGQPLGNAASVPLPGEPGRVGGAHIVPAGDAGFIGPLVFFLIIGTFLGCAIYGLSDGHSDGPVQRVLRNIARVVGVVPFILGVGGIIWSIFNLR